MKKMLAYLCALFLLSAFAGAAAAESSAVPDLSAADEATPERETEAQTALWEQTCGPYELWDYETNARFAAAFGTLPGGYTPYWLPVEPSGNTVSFENAVFIAKALLYRQDSRFTTAYCASLSIASSYRVADAPGGFFSQEGTWVIEFWRTAGAAFRDNLQKVAYVYVDAHTGKSTLLMIAVDQTAPDDYDHVRVVENPS
jgi:hypothetical protein